MSYGECAVWLLKFVFVYYLNVFYYIYFVTEKRTYS